MSRTTVLGRGGVRVRAGVGAALSLALVAGAGGDTAGARVGTPDVVGQWTEPFAEAPPEACQANPADPPCSATTEAMAVLPDGRVLYLGGPDPSGTEPVLRAGLLDLSDGEARFATPAAAGHAPWGSSDLASLSDGRLLIGGTGAGGPRGSSTVFDPASGSFQAAATMTDIRREASLVTLADGRVMVAGGSRGSGVGSRDDGPLPVETFNPETGMWLSHVGSEVALPLEPRLHLMPNGKVFSEAVGRDGSDTPAGDEVALARERFFDPVSGRWEVSDLAPFGPRDGAASILLPLEPPFDQATLLTAGGSIGRAGLGTPAVPLATFTTVDRGGNVAHSRTTDMLTRRWFPSAVMLPDGGVLVMGGSTGGPVLERNTAAVPTVELFTANSGIWEDMSSPSHVRSSRHAAVLLADGRVLFGGPAVGSNQASFEVYSPPYLFRGARPQIKHAPAGLAWGQTFKVRTNQAAGIEQLVLVRLPSPQHGADSDMRMLRLGVSRTGSGEITTTAPPSGDTAPPGFYYLFIVRSSLAGPIPSVARIVQIGPAAVDGEALQPFPDDAKAPAPPADDPHPAPDPVQAPALPSRPIE